VPGNATSVRSKPRSVYSKLPTYPFAREEFLASEMRWLKLAENYELSERLTYFLNRPPVFPKHPICPNCHVPMWLLEIQSRSEKVEFFYECKVCEAKETVTGSNDCHARNKTSREVPAAHNACLAALSPAAFASLKPYLTYSTMEPRTVLWNVGEPASHVFFPMSGLVSIMVSMREGNGVEVGNIGREAAVCGSFEPNQLATSDGLVSIGGSFGKIAREHLFAAAEHSDEILALVTRCRDWVLTQAQQIVACNTLHAGEERLSRWLLLCSQKLHTTTFVITQEQLAAMLGVRRTTFTLIAQRLVAKGLIKYRRGKITICDPARLREAGCECCARLGLHHWPSVGGSSANFALDRSRRRPVSALGTKADIRAGVKRT
jgi:Crp-like helix-turn-helix domain